MNHEDAKKLLGFPENCTTQIKNVGNNCFRVNVYERDKPKDITIFTSKIYQSAFVRLTPEGYKNITIYK